MVASEQSSSDGVSAILDAKIQSIVITKENEEKFKFLPRIMAQRVTFYIDGFNVYYQDFFGRFCCFVVICWLIY